MSLIDELQISLKDPDAVPATDAIISDRLFARLMNYADSHHTPLTNVVEQLRDEIHHKMAW